METIRVGNGYALWFLPEERVYSKLASQILALSREYSTPAFEPHVTLISGIKGPERDALLRSSRLARLLHPLEMRLTTLGIFDDYFRSLFIRVAPVEAVTQANQSAREIFGLQHQPPYMPHMSLFYSDFPEEAKREIAESLDSRFDLSFRVSEVHLYSVEGCPEDWYPVETYNIA